MVYLSFFDLMSLEESIVFSYHLNFLEFHLRPREHSNRFAIEYLAIPVRIKSY